MSANIVHVPTAQYIDRETLELANKVFSLYNVSDRAHPQQGTASNTNPNPNFNSNSRIQSAESPLLQFRSTATANTATANTATGNGFNPLIGLNSLNSHSGGTVGATGHVARGEMLRVRHPGFTMPDKNGWNKPQHVPLQKQSVDITESAKPQRTTHPMTYTMQNLINPVPIHIGSGRDSQSQSVPQSVSSNSVSSSGQNRITVNGATSHKFRCRFCDKECGSECRLEVHL